MSDVCARCAAPIAEGWSTCPCCGAPVCDGCAPAGCPRCGSASAEPDAWKDDLRVAVAAGLPRIAGSALTDDGLPDLRAPGTRNRYLRRLLVGAWICTPRRAFDGTIWVQITEGVEIAGMFAAGGGAAVFGADDPAGPSVRPERWREPTLADCVAFALRCASAPSWVPADQRSAALAELDVHEAVTPDAVSAAQTVRLVDGREAVG